MSGPVRVRIDELVLDGVSGDPAAVGAAVEAALARRLAGRALDAGGVGPGDSADVVAEQVAGVIERNLP